MKSQYEATSLLTRISFRGKNGEKLVESVFERAKRERHEHRKQEVYLRTAGRRESCDRHILRSRNRIG